MRTMLVIIGNMGSGKSTIAKELLQHLPNYITLSIDTFRHQHQAYTTRAEHNAWQALTIQAYKQDYIIFESSGISQNYNNVLDVFKKRGGRVIVVKIECSPHTCLLRIRQRLKQGYIPPPYPYRSNTPTTVFFLHDKIQEMSVSSSFNSELQSQSEIVNEIIKLL